MKMTPVELRLIVSEHRNGMGSVKSVMPPRPHPLYLTKPAAPAAPIAIRTRLPSLEFTPTKSLSICGFELSKSMSCRNLSRRKTFRLR